MVKAGCYKSHWSKESFDDDITISLLLKKIQVMARTNKVIYVVIWTKSHRQIVNQIFPTDNASYNQGWAVVGSDHST